MNSSEDYGAACAVTALQRPVGVGKGVLFVSSDYACAKITGVAEIRRTRRLNALRNWLVLLAGDGLRQVRQGRYQAALARAAQVVMVAAMYRDLASELGIDAAPPADVADLLLVCQFLNQPYELTVETAESDDRILIGARAENPLSRYQRDPLLRILPYPPEVGNCILAASWGDAKGNKKVQRQRIDLLGRIECSFSLPVDVDCCEFRLYRAGLLCGEWRLHRSETSRGWQLTAV